MIDPQGPIPAEPWFLQGSVGPVFAMYFPPPGTNPARAVIILPPFAEEMNRSRRMLALQARQLAAAGIGALILDLYGTGDSGGDFADARWEVWLDDVTVAVRWLNERGAGDIGMLGPRFGALLAAAAQRQAGLRCFRTVFWQPVILGRAALTEFLRLNVGAGLLGREGGGTMDVMRARLDAGENVEVAGYALPPALAAAIQKLDLSAFADESGGPVTWFEIVHNRGDALSIPGSQCVERWTSAGVAVDAAGVEGRPFWIGQSITLVPELLAATTRAFAGSEG